MTSTLRLLEKFILLLVVTVPLLAVPVGIIQVWGWGIDWPSLAQFVCFILLTGCGITVGYHRLFTHHSFEAVRWLKITLAILGSMALEGPVATWVARHNKHHKHADDEGDPHSPLDGFWHAHVGFLFTEEEPDKQRFASHVLKDSDLVWISRLFPLWALLSFILPAGIGYAVSGTGTGALLGFLWGGLIRIAFVHHITWSINSVCHVFGSRRFNTPDQSTNNWVCAFFGFGEGNHNNHHKFPWSASHGLGEGPDGSYRLIRWLEKLGLVYNVRVPDEAKIQKEEART